MWFVTAIASAFIFGIAGLFMKCGQAYGGSDRYLLAALYMMGTIGFLVQMDGSGAHSLSDIRIWIGGLIIAVGSAGGNYLFMKALAYGPASLTSPLVNMNIVLVIAMSVIWFGEVPSWIAWGGIILLLAAAWLVSWRPGETLSIGQKWWLVLVGSAIIVFSFRNGGLKVTDSIGLDNTLVLFAGYLAAAVWFSLSLLYRSAESDGSGSREKCKTIRTGVIWGLGAGVFSSVGMYLYAVALKLGPASIVAPIFATNSLVVAAGSILLFRERLSRTQALALVCLFAGLALVRME